MSAPAVLGSAVAVLLLALPVAAACSSVEGRHRLDGAADAAVLAAADAVSGRIDADPCALAAEVLAAASARLDECRVDEGSGRVRLRASTSTMLGSAHACVHAGPPFP